MIDTYCTPELVDHGLVAVQTLSSSLSATTADGGTIGVNIFQPSTSGEGEPNSGTTSVQTANETSRG